jgi:hypothetical protein
MNAQEHTLVSQLLDNLTQAASQLAPSAVDPQAAMLINQAFTAQPHMAYLLTQRHLLLEQALNNAQAHIQTLERAQAQSEASARTNPPSFLGGAQRGWSNPAPAAELNAYGQPIGRAAPASPSTGATANALPSAAGANPAAMNAAPAPSQGGSFLGTAAAAATGVLGGALLFQGIEHLMGGGNAGLMGGSGLAGNGAPVEEVTNITENFYGNASGSDLNTADNTAGWDNSAFNDPSADPINDPSTGADSFDTGGWDNDLSNTADNSSLFDSSGNDDSGGFFGGLFGGGDSGDDDWV